MQHADAVCKGVSGGGDVERLSVESDGTGVGRVEAGEDLHEGRLSCTVLAKETVQVSRCYLEGYSVVGVDRSEPFVDVPQLEAHAGVSLVRAVVAVWSGGTGVSRPPTTC